MQALKKIICMLSLYLVTWRSPWKKWEKVINIWLTKKRKGAHFYLAVLTAHLISSHPPCKICRTQPKRFKMIRPFPKAKTLMTFNKTPNRKGARLNLEKGNLNYYKPLNRMMIIVNLWLSQNRNHFICKLVAKEVQNLEEYQRTERNGR